METVVPWNYSDVAESYRKRARELYASGVREHSVVVEDQAAVSIEGSKTKDKGAWVQAWVWVSVKDISDVETPLTRTARGLADHDRQRKEKEG